MPPRAETINYHPEPGVDADRLVSGVDRPPAWMKILQWVPLIGTYLNVMAQGMDYLTPLEDCVDLIARDMSAGLESEFIGHRVAVKVKPKTT